MPRLPYTEPGEGLLPLNIFKVLAHAPKLADSYSRLGGRILARTELDPKLRELVINAISLKLDCPYEWSHHAKCALDVGASRDELGALKSGDLSKLGPLENACVTYARKVDDGTVEDGDVDDLRNAGLTDQQIMELTFTAGFYGMTARILNATAVEIDEGNQGDFAMPEEGGSSRARQAIEERT